MGVLRRCLSKSDPEPRVTVLHGIQVLELLNSLQIGEFDLMRKNEDRYQ